MECCNTVCDSGSILEVWPASIPQFTVMFDSEWISESKCFIIHNSLLRDTGRIRLYFPRYNAGHLLKTWECVCSFVVRL